MKLLLLISILLWFAFWQHPATAQINSNLDSSMRLNTISGDEELVIIQTVSASRATFVIRKGAREGAVLHQKALFSTDKVSILCKAIEVTSDYSLWQVADPKMQVPFQKRQFVVLNTSLETIWQKIPHLKEELTKRVAQAKAKPVPYWIIRAGSSRGVYASVSETGSQASSERVGLQFDGSYNSKLIESVDYSLGLRMDNETSKQETPNLVITTVRYFLTGELIYNFPDFSNTSNHFYSAAGGGIGTSQTDVAGAKSAGTAFLGPVFRFGLRTKLSEKYSLLVEGAAEAISMNETFADGTRQTTNIVNGKFSIGLRF
ncbi:MAG: hypothetical protein HYV97_11120 [Bdellovibrio sp.]|nr:hypothetical protein [Bdellovibrio sp.]